MENWLAAFAAVATVMMITATTNYRGVASAPGLAGSLPLLL